MRKLHFIFYLIAASLLSGCLVTSLHPLFTAGQIVFEPKLLGAWTPDETDPKEFWVVEKATEKGYYITMNNEEASVSLTAHAIQLGTNLFLNLRISKQGMKEIREMEGPYLAFLQPTHLIVKISQIEPTLQTSILNPKALRKFLQDNPAALRHEKVENDEIVITASSKEQQDFLLKYAQQTDLFTLTKPLKRSPENK